MSDDIWVMRPTGIATVSLLYNSKYALKSLMSKEIHTINPKAEESTSEITSSSKINRTRVVKTLISANRLVKGKVKDLPYKCAVNKCILTYFHTSGCPKN